MIQKNNACQIGIEKEKGRESAALVEESTLL